MFINFIENARYHHALLLCLRTCEQRSSTSKNHDRWPKGQWILGHRGARSEAPENTLSAFRIAMEHGADGVEFDVMPSRDAHIVVIHDESLERTTDGRGLVWYYDKDYLADLDATKIKSGFAKEGVPTLIDTLALLPDNAVVNIELKNRGHLSIDEFLSRVESDISRHNDRLRIVVSSFDADLLYPLRKKNVNFLIAQLLCRGEKHWRRALKLLPLLSPDAIHVTQDLAGSVARELAHRAHMRIAIWTINNPKTAKKHFDRGIDGIITDRVKETVAYVRGKRVL